ncbi:3'(2'),5'-bisphosphate nucleotidase CysQ [Pseudomonas saliphila]|uniref:3'(2'),5'-bisphosphate nucleotidase CysQ n=1 Tax=Pseudomonas saliphila TaxID=2586906 RepID=UPI00123860F2|nr:3'(2'),5'-bisphosphate nucleotidase CysQ [Pseudomonas saliphila]
MSLPVSFDALCQLTRRAGDRTLEWWRQNPEVTDKSDDSPVTAADLAAHHLIVAGLHALTPDIPVLSEEDADAPLADRLNWARFWLVDPLDGTKEFIAGTDEFTVNIALIENGQVVLGVVGVPARNTLYWGGQGLGAWRQQGNEAAEPIQCRAAATPLVVVASRRHTSPAQEAMLSRIRTLQQIEQVSVGSSLKFCLVAEGQADLYPRLAPTSQWDTAAAQAVVEGAGGRVIGLDGERFAYPTRESWLNGHFVAMGDVAPELLAQVLG